MIVLAYRPDYDQPSKNLHFIQRIILEGLDAEACPKILASLMENRKVSPEIIQFIMDRSRGNPLFIKELARSLIENGYVDEKSGKYVLSKKLLEIAIPDSIQGIVSARIDRLHELPKRVLQRAAVIGKTFSLSLLSAIMGNNEIQTPLFQLLEGEFISQKVEQSEETYEFRHDLIHEVAYNSLLKKQRKGLHNAVAQAIEGTCEEHPWETWEVLAYHYSLSENTQKAFYYLKLSGNKAIHQSSLWEGFNYYKAALDMIKKQPSSLERSKEELDLLLSMVSPMISLGFPDDSLELLQDGEGLAHQSGSAHNQIVFSSLIGLYCSVRGQLSEGQSYTEKCLKIADQSGDVELIASSAFDACSNYSARGDFLKVRRVAQKVIKLIEEENREGETFYRGYNIYSALLGFWGFSEAYLGNFQKGEDLCRKGLIFAESPENLPSLGLIETCHGFTLAHRGQGSDAIPHFIKAIDHLTKGHVSVLVGLAQTGLGWAHFFSGQEDTAIIHIEKGLAAHSETGIHYKSSVPYWFLSHIHLEKGDVEQAMNYATLALNHARTNNEVYLEGIVHVLMGSCLSKKQKDTPAEESFRKGIHILESLEIKPYMGVAYLYLANHFQDRRSLKKARSVADKAFVIFKDTDMSFWLSHLVRDFPDLPR